MEKPEGKRMASARKAAVALRDSPMLAPGPRLGFFRLYRFIACGFLFGSPIFAGLQALTYGLDRREAVFLLVQMPAFSLVCIGMALLFERHERQKLREMEERAPRP